ncbi:DASS family sodium-coupled anion symporter [Sulfurimonas sp. HSL-3221]|uniref:SLC13 family permease n=1 Tax=Thiomicrolovo sulfuroxydans TaxID=2894755 RepID=UPI001E5461D9|nr:DASS family sodium-coupled anion symporter [Sulfurimonas sp. HSL-3221]UFS61783.1 DASS family sodium-coupled anion symporter [Sulfurimonas sp. HSL-3221]
MIDTRQGIRKFANLGGAENRADRLIRFAVSLIIALLAAYLPAYTGLGSEGRATFFILIFAAGLWLTEAIPAFAVSFLIIALEIVLLGLIPGGEWEAFLSPWASPLVFLFLAGFIMASAASKTRLDIWIAKRVLFLVGNRPEHIMSGMILVTFTMSMFISNTATAALIVSILFPMLATMRPDNPYRKGLMLAVTMAANIGGMGTIIGTPPNAIAVGLLGTSAPSFVGWMMLALPPALLLVISLRYLLLKRYPSNEPLIDLGPLHGVDHTDDTSIVHATVPSVPSWKKSAVVLTFSLTIMLWLTGPLHHIPTTVVSFLPIVIFTMLGILEAEDIRALHWDVIILIIGGLSLGSAVSSSGLDDWIATLFAEQTLPLLLLVPIFAYLVVLLSNFMSNTAAANILLPLVAAVAVVIGNSSPMLAVVTVALSASLAMALPVSTPPNAIVFASGALKSRDFWLMGIVSGVLGPLVILGWIYLVSTFF